MTITQEQFKAIFGVVKDAEEIVKQLNAILPTHGINTKARIAAFLAQAGHESGHFKARVENLNYSAKALLSVFPKYFDAERAAEYQRKPEKIASRVYANRMGNGDEASKDGWKYRGRGYIQLTGKDNYTRCGKDLGVDLLATPEYLETIEGAIKSACWYWTTNKLNQYADSGDIKALTKRINGGYNGLEDRVSLYKKATAAL